MSRPDLSIEHELRPEFYDVDPMEVVWHGNYVKFFEATRAALLEKFNYGYREMKASGYAWPIVDLRVKYVGPAHYAQQLIVRAEVVEWENRLRIDYLIRDKLTGKKITTGHTIQVAVDMSNREMCFVCPQVLWDKLGVEPS